jgi:hypothetical protein
VTDAKPFRPEVSVAITVQFSTPEGSETHTVTRGWRSKNGLTAVDLPEHVDEMVLRTADALKPTYRTKRA